MADPNAPPPESRSGDNAQNPPATEHSDIPLERQVLGGLMLAGINSFDRVHEHLDEGSFVYGQHRLIYRGLCDLADNGKELDSTSLAAWLKRRKKLSSAGGADYIEQLVVENPSTYNLEQHAGILADLAARRQMIAAGALIRNLGGNPEGRNADELQAEAEGILAKHSIDGRAGGLVAVRKHLDIVERRIEELQGQKPGTLTGLPTGFSLLDKITSGLQKGNLVIVAGRPGMGKSAFAMNVVENALPHTDGRPIAVFSMEMSAEEIVMRMLASRARVPLGDVRTRVRDKASRNKITRAAEQLRTEPLYIDNTGGLSVGMLQQRVRRLEREHGHPALVMVDYLQLMRAPSYNDRVQEISSISRGLKELAQEHGCPVMALSQLSRKVEARPKKRPLMGDLRESGSIEQDADMVLFIYREAYYREENKDEMTPQERREAELIIAKHRNGELGIVDLNFTGEHMLFEDRPRTDSSYDDMAPPGMQH